MEDIEGDGETMWLMTMLAKAPPPAFVEELPLATFPIRPRRIRLALTEIRSIPTAAVARTHGSNHRHHWRTGDRGRGRGCGGMSPTCLTNPATPVPPTPIHTAAGAPVRLGLPTATSTPTGPPAPIQTSIPPVSFETRTVVHDLVRR